MSDARERGDRRERGADVQKQEKKSSNNVMQVGAPPSIATDARWIGSSSSTSWSNVRRRSGAGVAGTGAAGGAVVSAAAAGVD